MLLLVAVSTPLSGCCEPMLTPVVDERALPIRPLRAHPRDKAYVVSLIRATAVAQTPEERDYFAAQALIEVGHGWDYEERMEERWPE